MILRSLCLILFLGALSGQWAQAQAQAPKSPVLSLEEAISKTLKNHPELKAMASDAQAARAQVPQVRAWEDPLAGVRFYQVPFGKGLSDATDVDYVISQKIPFPGKKKIAGEIAYHRYLHHLDLLDLKGRSLLKEVQSAYFSLFTAHQMLGVSREAEGLLKSIIQNSQASLSVNQSTVLESIQGRTELSRLLTERQSLFQKKETLEAKLKQLMALEDPQELRLPSQLKRQALKLPLEKLLEIARLHHPSAKTTEHQIEEKNLGVKAARREYLPDFTAQLEYIQRPGPAENAWTGELMLNVPLNLRKKGQAVSQAQAELASARYQSQATRNEILFKVEALFSRLKASEKILQIQQSSLIPQTRQGLEISRVALGTGQSPPNDSLQWVKTLLEARMSYWKAFEESALSFFELEEAVGMTQGE